MQHQFGKKMQISIRIALLAFYCVMLVLLLMRHENWRDEGQAWLLARDLDFLGLVRQMRYEGHPCLWHVLLMPLAKTGMPYVSMNVLSVVLTVCAVALMLWSSPVPLPIQVIILTGAPFLYLFPIVSRSYSLIPLFLFLNAAIYPRRVQRPLFYGLSIALLIQTHIMMLGMAAALSLFWLGEALCAYRKARDAKTLMKQAAGLSIPLISLFLLIVQLYGSRESSAYPDAELLEPKKLLWTGIGVLKKSFDMPDLALSMLMVLLFAIGVIGVFVCAMHRAAIMKPLLIFLMGWGMLVMMLVVTGRLSIQKVAVLLPMLTWLLWIEWPHAKAWVPRGALVLMAFAVCLPMIYVNREMTITDWIYSFSDSRECAAYLEHNVPGDSVIAVEPDSMAASLLPYMTRDTLTSMHSGQPISYATWVDREQVIDGVDGLREWMRQNRPDEKEAWLVEEANAPILNGEPGITMVYETMDMDNIRCEKIRVYRVDFP